MSMRPDEGQHAQKINRNSHQISFNNHIFLSLMHALKSILLPDSLSAHNAKLELNSYRIMYQQNRNNQALQRIPRRILYPIM